MSDNFNLSEIVIPNETKHQIYLDGFQPTVKELGTLAGRIPRAINAALAPLDKWISQREYNIEDTETLLSDKLSTANPDKIVSPEPYVAIPALQAISYSMSSTELHNLYANLLAKAMFSDTKDKVHPSFVELIKQMSPNDALILGEVFKRNDAIPAATFSIVMKFHGAHLRTQAPEEKTSFDIVADIRNTILTEDQIRISLDNLKRLGILSLENFPLADSSLYDFVKQTKLYDEMYQEYESLKNVIPSSDYFRVNRKCYILTPLGQLFCDICIDDFC